jgi:2-polyprenyl-6-methoxyphenol hydroxylase-like FAD-dependent oxidoreductase
MDALLAKHFVDCGGELQPKKASREHRFHEGVVRATGRAIQPIDKGWRWFGLKVHARNVDLNADLEMHCQPNQYVGINRIEEGKVNVCGLFRRRASVREPLPAWQTFLRGPPGSPQYERLRDASFDETSFCSVAGLPLRPQRAGGRDECCIGDALTMIPPVTGNGMSMAFEAAELAIEPLIAYARAQMSWNEAQQTIAKQCDVTFSRRLRWASWLQALLFRPWMQTKWGRPVLASGLLWRLMFATTR